MKYTVNRTNFNDFSIYELNRREGRAYTIPYSSKETLAKTAFKKERYSSDIVKVLLTTSPPTFPMSSLSPYIGRILKSTAPPAAIS